jgi:allantoinase
VQHALWEGLLHGQVDVIASDHSPAPPSMKGGEFMSAWGGIAGVQSTLAVLLEKGYHERQLPLERVVALVATEPARRFSIPAKGSLQPGHDADIVLVDLDARFTLAATHLHQRHRMSPYLGSSFRGAVRRTIRRGETIFVDGQITVSGGGALVRPR